MLMFSGKNHFGRASYYENAITVTDETSEVLTYRSRYGYVTKG